jgi:hypothetical protein
MDLSHLTEHPEQMDKDSLYELRSLIALYPYYQTARLLMLQNLYLLHDPSFDEELRKAAIYINDRKVIFKLIESGHYKIQHADNVTTKNVDKADKGSRTISLIDNFLESIPDEEDKTKTSKRKPTPADAAVDYVSYLLETESEETKDAQSIPQMKGQSLIDNFINHDGGKIELKETPEYVPQIEDNSNEKDNDTGYFTETLAKIYIKQGRYSKALEIIRRLNLEYPKKNAYFADQIRFLEKLIINNNNK